MTKEARRIVEAGVDDNVLLTARGGSGQDEEPEDDRPADGEDFDWPDPEEEPMRTAEERLSQKERDRRYEGLDERER